MNNTQINWTNLTWNVWSGCEPVSAGCKFCYAEQLAEQKRGSPAFPAGFDLTVRRHKLSEPRRHKVPSLIFVNSMSDFFWDKVPDSLRDDTIAAMEAAPHHRYQVLTKRPEAAAEYLCTRKLPRTVWLGVTVEHALTEHRIDTLRTLDASVRFLSVEPLIGPLSADLNLDGIHWVITGGESGRHLLRDDVRDRRGLVTLHTKGQRWQAREDRMDWVRNVRDNCQRQDVAFWHKQWGGSTGHLAGRLLDGVEHNGMVAPFTG